MASIRSILHRRTDLSTFVVHLTRRRNESYSGQDALVDIARSRRLEARTPLGWAKAIDDPNDASRQSQRVVCFSETPLEHINLMIGHIDGRSIEMEPYGVALPKLKARKLGINPVWYIDMTPEAGSNREWLSNSLDKMKKELVAADAAGISPFHKTIGAKLFPFMEQMGTWSSSSKEFWWEREWRHVGDVPIPTTSVIWLCPEGEIDAINDRVGAPLNPWLDPRWGLEEIIARLAGFPLSDVTPFN